MSSSIITVSNGLRVTTWLFACTLLCVGVRPSAAQEISVPQSVAAAGTPATISTSGSGGATFYLVGPGTALKRQVNLGEEIRLESNDLRHAGQYLAIICAGECRTSEFYVTASQPATLGFLVHPSRVPVGQPDAVSGVALVFDRFENLVLNPITIEFTVGGTKENLFSRPEVTHDGEAWFRTNSGKAGGAVHLTATVGDLTAKRVVQQVASDPCNLRIKAQRSTKGIEVETEPVRDCAGNAVSDGTIVTFSGTGPDGKVSVDAPIKADVARALIKVPGPVTISAASGVAMGNELRVP